MNSFDIWNELGNAYFALGKWDKAIDAYLKAIDDGLQSGWACSNLAAIYVKQNRYLDAIPLYQKCLDLFDDRKDLANTWGRLGNMYHHLNEYGKAIQAYQKADEILPSWMNNKNIFSTLHETVMEDSEQTLIPGRNSKLNELTAWDEEVSSIYPLVASETENDICEDAPSIIDELLNSSLGQVQQFEENANVWNELGLVLFKVGAYDDAVDAYKKAILIDHSLGYLYSNLAQVFVTQGKLSDAIALYHYSIRLLPTKKEKAVSWSRLGDIFRQLGQKDLFIPAYLLSEVLNQEFIEQINEYRQIHPGLINTSLNYYRDINDIEDLVKSIQAVGVIQPLIVCPDIKEPGKFILISGRRRLAAVFRLGLQIVPVIVRQVSNLEMIEISINDNIHTNVTTPFEIAQGYQQLANDFGLSIEEISERVGRSCHSVANTMKIIHKTNMQEQSFSDNSNNDAFGAEIGIKTDHIFYSDEVEPIENQEKGFYQQVNAVLSEVVTSDLSSKRLWYLDNANTEVSPKKDENILNSNSSSLLSRARDVLSSNPHPNRILPISSYRA